jgi:hypothetical protein
VAEDSAIAARHRATYGFVECVLADPEEMSRRLRERPRLRSQMTDVGVPSPDAPPDTVVVQVAAHGPAVLETKYPASPRLWVDTSQPPARCLALALDYLQERRRPADALAPRN